MGTLTLKQPKKAKNRLQKAKALIGNFNFLGPNEVSTHLNPVSTKVLESFEEVTFEPELIYDLRKTQVLLAER